MNSETTDSAASQRIENVLKLDEIEALLVKEGGKPAETLMNVVALIARRFATDVCSAYLLEPDRANLVLAATLGLRRECIGTLRMALTEGLAGLVAERLLPVAVEQVKVHPRFKYFSESGEDIYQSFLGVPLIDRGVLQGVLVVQTVHERKFDDGEIRMLSAAAAELAPIISEELAPSPGSSRRCRKNCGRWPAICGGVGIRSPTGCSGTSIPRAGAGSITIRFRC